jgi:hypothetical protein
MDYELDPFKDVREMNRALDPFKEIRAMTAALDPFKDIREMNRRLDAFREIRGMAEIPDPFKDIREMTAALRPFRAYRELTDRLTVSAVLSVSQTAAAASGSLADILAGVNASVEAETSEEEEPLSEWLALLPTLAQRRLLLLALGALWAITDALDSMAGVAQPAHLDKVIIALLAIATFLSEAVGEPPTRD